MKDNVLITKDASGNKLVVLPQIIFSGRRSISWKEVEEYFIFKAVLIIRYAADNKLYLYDIQNIKKETSKPF